MKKLKELYQAPVTEVINIFEDVCATTTCYLINYEGQQDNTNIDKLLDVVEEVKGYKMPKEICKIWIMGQSDWDIIEEKIINNVINKYHQSRVI